MKPPGPQPTDARDLASLRTQFEACADTFAFELARIASWLHAGHPREDRPSSALAAAPDHASELRYLLNLIADITERADRA